MNTLASKLYALSITVAALTAGCGACPDGTDPDPKTCVCMSDGTKPKSCTPPGTTPADGVSGKGGDSNKGGSGGMSGSESDVDTGVGPNPMDPVVMANRIEVPAGTITRAITWSKQGDKPYVLAGEVKIAKDAKLTIEQGVLIKANNSEFSAGFPLIVDGELEIAGADGEPVVLTNIHDDGQGGDTNDNEGATTGKSRLWSGIQFNKGSSGTISFAEMYFAQTAITTDDATVALDHVRIDDCGTAISSLPTDQVSVSDLDVTTNTVNGLVRRGATIGTDTVWQQTDAVQVLGGEITIAESATLTVEQGVVVKASNTEFGNGFAIVVKGGLQVMGTQDDPVIFTNLHDDERGGDTNGNEAASKPHDRAWGGIQFSPKASGEIRFAEIRYATAAIAVNGCSPTIEGAVLEANGVGISATGAGASPSITNSSFIDNVAGAAASGEAKIDATNNWWGATDGPSVVGMDMDTMGMGDSVTADVTFKPFMTSAP